MPFPAFLLSLELVLFLLSHLLGCSFPSFSVQYLLDCVHLLFLCPVVKTKLFSMRLWCHCY